jgi:predicted dehydrogenase
MLGGLDMGEKIVNVGIVGLGYWGPNLLRNFSLAKQCKVKYGCDLSDALLKKFSQQYHFVKFVNDYQILLDDKELDAVLIATPVSTHFPLAKLALEHGKHVLVEKPMATNTKECNQLIELAKKNNRTLLVDHTFLYTGAVRKIKELINKNELGKLTYFDSERINLGLIQSDSNVIWDLAPHDIAIMNYLFEGHIPESVFAIGTRHVNNKFEEMAHVTVKYSSGLVGHLHVSWLSPVKIRKILVGGDKKMILYNDIEPSEKIRIYDKGVYCDEITSFKPAYRSGDVLIPTLDNSEALLVEANHFVQCVLGKEKPISDGKSGLEVVRILEACDESLKTGRIVKL